MKPDKRDEHQSWVPDRRGFPLPIMGILWYSANQRKMLDSAGRKRTFGKILKDGSIVEYTQMIPPEDIIENPGDRCFFDDAVCLGEGAFHHWEGI